MDDLRNALPKELIELTIHLMDYKTKLNIRATNRYWFSCVKLTDFQIYFASPHNVAQIVQHFSKRYENQTITMSLKKSVNPDILSTFPLQQLTALTNLTALDLDLGYRAYPASTILFALTNLQRLNGVPSVGTALTNLTTLMIQEGSDLTFLRLYSKLEQLTIKTYFNRTNIDPFAEITNPSRLTSLVIYLPKIEISEKGANTMRQLNNLKELNLQVSQADKSLSQILKHSTGLEKLHYKGQLTNDVFNLTRLTSLYVYTDNQQTSMDEIDLQRVLALHNLKHVNIPAASEQICSDFSFVSYLTNLEEGVINTNTATTEILANLNSKKITKLSMLGLDNSFTTEHLSNLSSLLELTVYDTFFTNSQNFAGGLTPLKSLTKLMVYPTGPLALQSAMLSPLQNLKSLTIWTRPLTAKLPEDFSLQILPNLEYLDLQCAPSQTTYNDLQYLTRLTYLEFSLTADVFNNNTSVLNKLPLRKLVFGRKIVAPEIWSMVTHLRALEYLQVWRVDSEEIIESFSVLTNLTSLIMKKMKMRNRVRGLQLTRLTNLQELSFRSHPRKYYARKPNDFLMQKGMTRLTSLWLH